MTGRQPRLPVLFISSVPTQGVLPGYYIKPRKGVFSRVSTLGVLPGYQAFKGVFSWVSTLRVLPGYYISNLARVCLDGYLL